MKAFRQSVVSRRFACEGHVGSEGCIIKRHTLITIITPSFGNTLGKRDELSRLKIGIRRHVWPKKRQRHVKTTLFVVLDIPRHVENYAQKRLHLNIVV